MFYVIEVEIARHMMNLVHFTQLQGAEQSHTESVTMAEPCAPRIQISRVDT